MSSSVFPVHLDGNRTTLRLQKIGNLLKKLSRIVEWPLLASSPIPFSGFHHKSRKHSHSVCVPGKRPWRLKYNSRYRFWPTWVLTWDQNSICLYRSCYSGPLKFGIWALTREWALVIPLVSWVNVWVFTPGYNAKFICIDPMKCGRGMGAYSGVQWTLVRNAMVVITIFTGNSFIMIFKISWCIVWITIKF